MAILSSVCIAIQLVSCKDVETKKEISVFDAPKYNITDYDISQYVSNIDQVYADTDNIVISGYYQENSVRIIERKNDDNTILNDIAVTDDPYNETKGDYFDGSYYENGIKYVSEEDTIDLGGIYHHRLIKTIKCNSEKISCLIKDEKQKYRIVEFDSNDSMIRNDEINVSDDKFVRDIVWHDDNYYLGVIQIEMAGDIKSYHSSILKLNDRLEVIQETEDIDIEGIDGIIPQNDESWIVYCYDEDSDETHICKADGDLSTFSEVKEFTGSRKIFEAEDGDNIYISDSSIIYKYNLITDEQKQFCSVPDITENSECTFLSCNDFSFAYSIKENKNNFTDIYVDSECDMHSLNQDGCSFEFYLNDEKKTIALNKITGNEICFPDLDEQDEIFYHSNSRSFLVINQNRKLEIYSDDGSCIGTIEEKDYSVDRLLLYGSIPAVLYQKNEDYYYADIDIENDRFSNIRAVSDPKYIKEASGIYNGNNNVLFYVIVDGYILGYLAEKDKYDVVADFASIYTDSPLLYINKISSGKYQLVTYNKLYCITKKDANEKNAEITVGNLTPDSLRPYLNLYPENFDDYKINIVDYFSESGDFSDLNQDIVSGDVPDIIISSTMYDVSYLENKGVLAELNKSEIFDGDCEYMDNIIDLFKTEGVLYKIPCGFSLSTMINYGVNNSEWNYYNLASWLEEEQDETYAASQFNLFRLFVPEFNQDFFSGTSKLTDSKKDTIKKIIEGVESWNIISVNDFSNYQEKHLTYEPVCIDQCMKDNVRNEKFEVCGYPTFDGPKSYVESSMLISVSSQSINKEECLDFIKRAIKKSPGASFSIEMNEFNNSINSLKLDLGIEIANKVEELVKNAHETAYRNRFVNAIVEEELFQYFEGITDLDTAIDNIENRVDLYVSEIK